MNVVVEVRQLGADKKLYRLRQLDQDALVKLRVLTHHLRHKGLSIRRVQDVLATEHGVRRSLGIIMRDLTVWSCEHCQDGSVDGGA